MAHDMISWGWWSFIFGMNAGLLLGALLGAQLGIWQERKKYNRQEAKEIT